MESVSPAATMAPPPAQPLKSKDPLLLSSFTLPGGWGCRRPMPFFQDKNVHVVPKPAGPAPTATAAIDAVPEPEEPQNDGPQSPAKGDEEKEEVPDAPRRQWNLRARNTSWRGHRAEDASPYKKVAATETGGGGGDNKRRAFSATLTRQEIDADFIAITGQKPPRKPKKRTRSVQREIQNLCPGSSLAELTGDRYKVNEKAGF